MNDADTKQAPIVEQKPIPFIDLKAQRARIAEGLDRAIARTLEGGAFILGPAVREFEQALAAFLDVDHVIGCASGTDALVLALRALEIGPGDAVFVPSFTFAATAEAVALVGATPAFVDVRPDSFNMDPDSLAGAIDHIASQGVLTPRAVIPVDLFGLPADYAALTPVAKAHGLAVIADAAQSCGALRDGVRTGNHADLTTFSFYPAKPLGCYGDGGAVAARDAGVAEALRSLRVHGKGTDKYDNVRIGLNSRLDTLQAAILLEKLGIFPDEIEARQLVAGRYGKALGNVVTVPRVDAGALSVWAQYTVQLDGRDAVQAALKARGVPTQIHYPKPLHRQPPYADYPVAPGGVPVTERLAGCVLSLPMHPYLDEATQDHIVAALREAVGGAGG